jgi:formylglycine-generating enzyme required for sulfatase activity
MGNPEGSKGDNYPVSEVSWGDAQEFIRRLNEATGKNYRLPTEAEWEFAARGGVKSNGYKYSGSNSLGSVAWYSNNYGGSCGSKRTVGTKAPNELGIYDMSGNLMEWCSDYYGAYQVSMQSDPKGPSSGSYRVRRGGDWYYFAGGCRVAARRGVLRLRGHHHPTIPVGRGFAGVGTV